MSVMVHCSFVLLGPKAVGGKLLAGELVEVHGSANTCSPCFFLQIFRHTLFFGKYDRADVQGKRVNPFKFQTDKPVVLGARGVVLR